MNIIVCLLLDWNALTKFSLSNNWLLRIHKVLLVVRRYWEHDWVITAWLKRFDEIVSK